MVLIELPNWHLYTRLFMLPRSSFFPSYLPPVSKTRKAVRSLDIFLLP